MVIDEEACVRVCTVLSLCFVYDSEADISNHKNGVGRYDSEENDR